MNLPSAFQDQMQELLKQDLSAFVDSLHASPLVSIRYNFQKKKNKKENYEGVKWNNKGVYLKERPIFTLDPAFHAGAYYVQEASSMFLEEAVRQCVDLDQHLSVLDLCAAPGGKSTLLASLLNKESFLLANEVIRNRYGILKYNLTKWGQANTHCSMADSKDFAKLPDFFDLAVVDAPCSGEGLFRKDAKAMEEWSVAHVQHCSARQKRILANAIQTLKPGGVLIYSTCTYNNLENCDNASWISENFDLEYLPLDLPSDWNIQDRQPGYQFYPHLTKGEGFYIACFRKKGTAISSKKKKGKGNKLTAISKTDRELVLPWIKDADQFHFYQKHTGEIAMLPENQLERLSQLAAVLHRWDIGTPVGELKKGQLVPSPALALSNCLSPSIQSITLSKEQALHYLRKDSFTLDEIPAGWALMKYEELGLGWIKGLKNRFNNYYPKEWRIRMAI